MVPLFDADVPVEVLGVLDAARVVVNPGRPGIARAWDRLDYAVLLLVARLRADAAQEVAP